MIEVRGLSISHPGGICALDSVDLDLIEGQHLALMGANGSGKTTLIRCLNGLLQPTSGSVLVDGLSTSHVDDLNQIRRRVGMVFQNPDDQLVTTSVEAEVAFGLENCAVPVDLMRQRVDEMLEAFSLERYRHTPPHLLSGGERQRLAIAAAVAMRPVYLLLDEPTALLDPASGEELMRWIERLCLDQGICIVHVTQSPEQASRAQRLLVLRRGSLAHDDKPVVVFADGLSLEEDGICAPFSVRCARSLPLPLDPLPLTIEDLDRQLAHWTEPASSERPSEPCDDVVPQMGIRHVSHTYAEGVPEPIQALDGVEMEIGRGQILAIAGASGSGKTTLVQHLNGLLRPTRGRVELDRIDLTDENRLPLMQLRRRVGLVFQFAEAQLFAETVAEDVAFGPQNVGLAPAKVDEAVATALDAVQLPLAEYGDRSPFHLSGGERRRVAIAGVLAMDPQVLVLDEPTAGLDAQSTRVLIQILQDLQRDDRSVVLVTHDMDLISELAPRLVILHKGQIAYDGPTVGAFDTEWFADEAPLIPPLAWRFGRLRQARDGFTHDLLTFADVDAYARSLIPAGLTGDESPSHNP
ncbi:MAG: energy-coupling factor transporter ATPase [Candidatus Latescibacteria bacterium]|nr:energy-coupling factor transporter ATPase [Candidatus Latescibacterota bacterium]